MGLPGKPDGMGGADVESYCREGRIAEVAAYCETDVVNRYRVWLRYELFRGRLTEIGLQASEANLRDYIRSRSDAKPHPAYVLIDEKKSATETDGLAGVQSGGEGEMFMPDTPGVYRRLRAAKSGWMRPVRPRYRLAGKSRRGAFHRHCRAN